MKHVKTIILPAAVLLLAGCAQSALERDFGESVRNMVRAQTMDPATAAVPSPLPPEGIEGDRLSNVLKTYHEDVAKPEEVGDSLTINVEGGD